MTSVRRLAVATVRRGSRTVLLTYPGLGIGNFLYFVLRAHLRGRHGRAYRVQMIEGLQPWLAALPSLRPYVVEPGQMRVRDRRENIARSFFQGFGTDFAREDLEAFVSEVLLSSPLLGGWRERAVRLVDEDVLTVNIRRGDYYAVEEFRRIYAFDAAAYVHTAVADASSEHGRFGRIHVVSDGVDWCKEHLPWLGDYAGTVTFVRPDDPPQQHLVDVALSRHLVLTNSTFSYWGAYVSNVVHGDNHDAIRAPRFFGRGVGDGTGDAWQLDPLWRIVEDVPGADGSGIP